jgi:hypothetical protein
MVIVCLPMALKKAKNKMEKIYIYGKEMSPHLVSLLSEHGRRGTRLSFFRGS